MTRKPETISIIVATRNDSASSFRCLQMLATLDNPSVTEVIIVDDGSPNSIDLPCTIANFFRNSSVQSKVVSSGGRGPAHARNVGAAKALGSLLWFVDDDIRVCPAAAEKLLQAAIEHPRATLGGGVVIVSPAD